MDPRHDAFEALRARAVEIGRLGDAGAYAELQKLIKSEFPVVRRAAAGAMVKLLGADSSLAGVLEPSLTTAIEKEDHEQVLEYMLKAFILCAKAYRQTDLDLLHDVARNPNHRDYVRRVASEAIAAGEAVLREKESRLRHWCTRCRKPITAAESAAAIARYGKPYCRHCLEERRLEDIRFEHNVEEAKTLRTSDGVAVQSRGEKRIGNWLAKEHIAYSYDARIMVAGDLAIRPDFYLPEFDIYIEYWGMDTPEYVANMEKKRFLYQRDRKRLISISLHDFDHIEDVLRQKLSRYIRV